MKKIDASSCLQTTKANRLFCWRRTSIFLFFLVLKSSLLSFFYSRRNGGLPSFSCASSSLSSSFSSRRLRLPSFSSFSPPISSRVLGNEPKGRCTDLLKLCFPLFLRHDDEALARATQHRVATRLYNEELQKNQQANN